MTFSTFPTTSISVKAHYFPKFNFQRLILLRDQAEVIKSSWSICHKVITISGGLHYQLRTLLCRYVSPFHLKFLVEIPEIPQVPNPDVFSPDLNDTIGQRKSNVIQCGSQNCSQLCNMHWHRLAWLGSRNSSWLPAAECCNRWKMAKSTQGTARFREKWSLKGVLDYLYRRSG